MIRIKVSCRDDMPPLIRQLPGRNKTQGDFCFFINEETEECDYWFILHSPEKSEKVRMPAENLFLLTGEPESMFIYPQKYLEQFSKILTCQNHILKKYNSAVKSMPASNWFAGARMLSRNPWVWDRENYLDYDYFRTHNEGNKLDKVCIVTSDKGFTKGHKARLDFIRHIKSLCPDLIDVYGTGFKEIKDKYELLSHYKYAVIMENSAWPDYWTEKLTDCFLCNCFPFYWGCTNLYHYFPDGSYEKINLDNPLQTVESMKRFIGTDTYQVRKNKILEAKRMVLDKYNVFFHMTNSCQYRVDFPQKNITVRPVSEFSSKLGFRIVNKIRRIINNAMSNQ